MNAKVIVPESDGFSETLLESMLESLSFSSAFFDQPIRVRGVLFAAGPDSVQLARDFAERRLGLSVLSIGHEAGTEKAWTALSRVLAHPQTAASRTSPAGFHVADSDCRPAPRPFRRIPHPSVPLAAVDTTRTPGISHRTCETDCPPVFGAADNLPGA
jgi:hypothetical protein